MRKLEELKMRGQSRVGVGGMRVGYTYIVRMHSDFVEPAFYGRKHEVRMCVVKWMGSGGCNMVR